MVVCVDEETVSGPLELEKSGVGLELKVEDSVVTVEETEVVPFAVEDGIEEGVEGVEGVEDGVEGFAVVVYVFGDVRSVSVFIVLVISGVVIVG